MTQYATSFSDVQDAYERVKSAVHRTPVITSNQINRLAGRELFFKCENLQKVGAFKFRGACNAVMQLSDEEAANGVVTHSSGNHAQAVALAAAQRGIPAHIVMPDNAPAVKRAAVEAYGARVIPCIPTLQARESTAQEVIQETAATFIHPYDNANVIAGQGTAALEFLEQTEGLDAIITPVGGGGLLSGTAIVTRSALPNSKVFAAEPTGADDAFRSFESGELIPQTGPNTIADGLLTSLGNLTWPIIRDHVDAIFTVDDDSIASAMRLIWERAKIVVEPSGAVPLSAVLSERFQSEFNGNRIGIIISGGNVNLDRLPWQ